MDCGGQLAICEVHHQEDGGVQGYSEAPTFSAANSNSAFRANCNLCDSALEDLQKGEAFGGCVDRATSDG